MPLRDSQHAAHCLNCTRLAKQLDAIRVDLNNAEVDLRVWRKRARDAEAKLIERTRQAPERALAQGVFDYWNLVCRDGRAREFGGDRLKNVIARLKHNHVTFLLTGVEGAATDPYIDAKSRVFDDLELICRSPEKLDSFIERAEIEKARLRASDSFIYPAWVMRHVGAGQDPEPRWQQILDKFCEVVLMDPRSLQGETECSTPSSTSTRASVA